MNKYIEIMKNSMLLGLSAVAFSACSDWTDVESVNLNTSSLETQNPQLYEAYLQEVRNYKQSEHKVMIVKFDNSANYPSGRGEHLTALPDSVDYIVLNNPDNLNEVVVKEMGKIKMEKGIKTLFSIDYATIEQEYQTEIENKEAETENNSAAQDGFLDFCEQRMDYYLSLYEKYGYDGINVIYNGVSLPGLLQEEKTQLADRQGIFFSKINAWKDVNQNAELLFEGKPQNTLCDKEFFTIARYIIVPSTDAISSDQLVYELQSVVTEGVPTDKFVYGVTMPSSGAVGNGYFGIADANGNRMYAVSGAASTVVSSKGNYRVKGVCVDHVQEDYYNFQKSYQNVREAIALMNPSI